jgi:hypothetical protein
VGAAKLHLTAVGNARKPTWMCTRSRAEACAKHATCHSQSTKRGEVRRRTTERFFSRSQTGFRRCQDGLSNEELISKSAWLDTRNRAHGVEPPEPGTHHHIYLSLRC